MQMYLKVYVSKDLNLIHSSDCVCEKTKVIRKKGQNSKRLKLVEFSEIKFHKNKPDLCFWA